METPQESQSDSFFTLIKLGDLRPIRSRASQGWSVLDLAVTVVADLRFQADVRVVRVAHKWSVTPQTIVAPLSGAVTLRADDQSGREIAKGGDGVFVARAPSELYVSTVDGHAWCLEMRPGCRHYMSQAHFGDEVIPFPTVGEVHGAVFSLSPWILPEHLRDEVGRNPLFDDISVDHARHSSTRFEPNGVGMVVPLGEAALVCEFQVSGRKKYVAVPPLHILVFRPGTVVQISPQYRGTAMYLSYDAPCIPRE